MPHPVHKGAHPGCPTTNGGATKIVMAEQSAEGIWSGEWATNMDTLEEAVTFAESQGLIVRLAFEDFGGYPCIVMRRLRDGFDQFQFTGEPDDPFFWDLVGLAGTPCAKHECDCTRTHGLLEPRRP